MTTVTRNNASTINVTSSTTSTGKLQLSVDSTVFDTLVDDFDATPPPPPTMRLNVANLSNGTVVTVQWQPWDGGPWTPFTPNSSGSGSFYDFPTPPSGATKDMRLQATIPTSPAVNPRFVLRTKTSRDR